VHVPAAEVAAKIRISVDIEVVDESTCRVELGSTTRTGWRCG
jgi:hypothetical protein